MLPRLLIFDDLFGRNLPDGRNSDRENLCANFLWRDVTPDAAARASRVNVKSPVAEAVFCRAQQPALARVGDIVRNDVAGALRVAHEGWDRPRTGELRRWAMVLVDLC